MYYIACIMSFNHAKINHVIKDTAVFMIRV